MIAPKRENPQSEVQVSEDSEIRNGKAVFHKPICYDVCMLRHGHWLIGWVSIDFLRS